MAAAVPPPAATRAYQRHRPETTALYEVVRDNLETLHGAIADGALAVRIPKHARKELSAYLGCGVLCRGFARLRCGECGESRLVAFGCKGRGFCPSCLGRRMNATSANLMERVLPETGLRQWVLTFPFPWRRRLAQDGALFGQLTRIFVETVAAALRSQLVHEPEVETRNRKRMDPDRRMYVAPWELRVGQLRVYDAVKEQAALVVVTKIGIRDRDRVIIGGEPFEL